MKNRIEKINGKHIGVKYDKIANCKILKLELKANDKIDG